MLNLRRCMAAALLVGAAMVPALAAAPSYALGSLSAAVPAVSAGWVLVGTYPNLGACLAAGPAIAAGRQWQCIPSPGVPGAYDLYVLS
jgi:hypothetical protein